VVCPAGADVTGHHPALSGAASGPLMGEIGGEKFVAKKILARTNGYVGTNVRYVSELHVYATEDVTCADTMAATKLPKLLVVRIGGASTKQDLTATMQPADGSYFDSTWKRGKKATPGAAWVRFDALDFTTLHGTMELASDKGSIAGTFTAEVCAK